MTPYSQGVRVDRRAGDPGADRLCCGAPYGRPAEHGAAQTSVDNARQAGAQTDAPVEFRQAQDKLAAAQAAAKDEKFDKAKRLAQEASVDADLAQQKAQSARAQRSVAELRQSINLLRQEMGLPPES